MLRSIHLRFALINLAIVLLAVVLTALFARFTVGGEFERYVSTNMERSARRLGPIVSFNYATNQGWEQIQPLVQQMSEATGRWVVVVDNAGVVVGDSRGRLVGQLRPASWRWPVERVMAEGRPVGSIHIDPAETRSPIDLAFLQAANRLLLITAVAAAMIAMVLTFPLFRRITQPLAALSAATRRMGKGDLTVRVPVQSNDEVGELSRSFNTMADGLARLEQLRRNMVADVAHELRSPLTNMRGYLEAARDELVKPDKQWVENLYEETMLLNLVIDDLQDLALAEAGQLRLDRQPVDVAEIVRSTVDMLQVRAGSLGVSLTMDDSSALPPADADPQRVRQVLLNLLSNALEFTPSGGLVAVQCTSRDNEIRIAVRDTGCGIAEEHLPFIFERFYRVDPSRSRQTGGAGLGLTIVQNLVEAHGGKTWVQSSLSKGSTFGFSLPIFRPPAAERA